MRGEIQKKLMFWQKVLLLLVWMNVIAIVCIHGLIATPLYFPGDNNDIDDIGLYAEGQLWLNRHHIMGRAVG